MKKAMWKTDAAGEYHFSDRVGASPQDSFFSLLKDDWLADELSLRLSGQTWREWDLKEVVLTQTPFYLYKTPVNRPCFDSGRCLHGVSLDTHRDGRRQRAHGAGSRQREGDTCSLYDFDR